MHVQGMYVPLCATYEVTGIIYVTRNVVHRQPRCRDRQHLLLTSADLSYRSKQPKSFETHPPIRIMGLFFILDRLNMPEIYKGYFIVVKTIFLTYLKLFVTMEFYTVIYGIVYWRVIRMTLLLQKIYHWYATNLHVAFSCVLQQHQ